MGNWVFRIIRHLLWNSLDSLLRSSAAECRMREDTMKNSVQLEAGGKFGPKDIYELSVETEYFNLT